MDIGRQGGLSDHSTLAMLDKMIALAKLYTQQIRTVNGEIER